MLNRTALTVFLYASFLYFLKRIVFVKRHVWFFRIYLDGKTMKGNFYKCGDKLQTPHFLSWSPIGLERPMFHCPAFFGTLSFE